MFVLNKIPRHHAVTICMQKKQGDIYATAEWVASLASEDQDTVRKWRAWRFDYDCPVLRTDTLPNLDHVHGNEFLYEDIKNILRTGNDRFPPLLTMTDHEASIYRAYEKTINVIDGNVILTPKEQLSVIKDIVRSRLIASNTLHSISIKHGDNTLLLEVTESEIFKDFISELAKSNKIDDVNYLKNNINSDTECVTYDTLADLVDNIPALVLTNIEYTEKYDELNKYAPGETLVSYEHIRARVTNTHMMIKTIIHHFLSDGRSKVDDIDAVFKKYGIDNLVINPEHPLTIVEYAKLVQGLYTLLVDIAAAKEIVSKGSLYLPHKKITYMNEFHKRRLSLVLRYNFNWVKEVKDGTASYMWNQMFTLIKKEYEQ